MGNMVDMLNMDGSGAGGDSSRQFPPTAEQQQVIDAVVSGENTAITAVAAAGKTAVLRMCAEAMPSRRGLFLAFNRAIADSARKSFPRTVDCKTTHSLAFGEVGRDYGHRLGGERMAPWTVASFLGANRPLKINGDLKLSPMALGSLAMATVARFCYSADSTVEAKHVPYVKGAEDDMDIVRTRVLPFARKAWEDIRSEEGVLPFSHDHYLTLWALKKPNLSHYDYVLVDEAQDLNPRMEAVLRDQKIQVVMVGDPMQSLFRWRNSVDAMSRMDAGARVVLSQSFRFGPAIAEQANVFLRELDAPTMVRGFDKVTSRVDYVESPSAILTRTNAGAIEEVIRLQQRGVPVAFVGGTSEIEKFAKGAESLIAGKQTLHPDLIAFPTWSDVVGYSTTPEGRDLRVMVNLINVHGTKALRDVARKTVPESEATTVVATVHKTKGLEYPSVRISNDFRVPTEDAPLSEEELMVCYVAVTRAQNVLDLGGLSFINTKEQA